MKDNYDFKEFLLPRDAGNVPSKAGIYRFVFRWPSNYELGISGDNKNIEQAIILLSLKLDRIASAINSQKLTGQISDKKQKHLRSIYKIGACDYSGFLPSGYFEDMVDQIDNEEDLLESIDIVRKLIGELPPIYIGITVERTLKVRLKEHLEGLTSVKANLEYHRLSWSDLKFQCMPVTFHNGAALRKIEKLLQHLHKPVFSKS